MESYTEHYDSLMATLDKYMPGKDRTIILQAIEYAENKHSAQKRKDGSPYIIHPLAVAEIIAEMGLDTDAILGALLHDCIEDTDASHEEIEKLFSTTVAELVEGVTKLTRADFSTSEQAQMENLRKMFMAMSKDIRVVLIKIADRLHNMRTMEYMASHKQLEKSVETMEIYAPIAHRLGMQRMKWELEDLSLKYIQPEAYNEIITKTEARERGWEGGSLEPYAPGMCIGGDRFYNSPNDDGVIPLPEKDGRFWTECDIDTIGTNARGAKRIVFSNDGLVYYTSDHYETFTLLYGEP